MDKVDDLLNRLGVTEEEYEILKDVIMSSKKREEEIKESILRAKQNLKEFEEIIERMNRTFISQQVYLYSKEIAESKT